MPSVSMIPTNSYFKKELFGVGVGGFGVCLLCEAAHKKEYYFEALYYYYYYYYYYVAKGSFWSSVRA